MMRSGLKEAQLNKLEITQFSFEVVKAAIDFCLGQPFSRNDMENLAFLLYVFSDYYGIESLNVRFCKRLIFNYC